MIFLIVLCTQREIYTLFNDDNVDNFLNIISYNDYSILASHMTIFCSQDDINLFQNVTRATVKTPKGTNVTVIDRTFLPNWSASEQLSINNEITSSYAVTIVGQPTKYYNCHSYAWYLSNAGNLYWMDNPSAYMSDGSYSKVTGIVAIGDKHYMNPTHSGIVSSISNSTVYIVSKWGEAGLYLGTTSQLPADYFYTHSPYNYTGSSQWR
ncbi:MAG: hypothetical protein FWG88_07870 [Oscillospiraceae bacterium]|nr:hypothetical protein [Oscillospiraceae bacterium]